MKHTNITHLVSHMIQAHSDKNIKTLVKKEQDVYQQLFETTKKEEIQLIFDSTEQAAQFFYDMKYSYYTLDTIKVFTDPTDNCSIHCAVEGSVIDYFHPYAPGFLTYSQNTKLNFRIRYDQSFTNSVLEADVIDGQLKHIRCKINYFQSLPQLSLGNLHHFIQSEEDIQLLNPTVVIISEKSHI